jgi:hypothetical protein
MRVTPPAKAFSGPSNLLSFGIEKDTVHRVGFQCMSAANPLVGSVTQVLRPNSPARPAN